MKIPKQMAIPEITREEHTSLIRSLDGEYEYIYLFDARVRVAIIHDKLHECYTVVACATDGTWYNIDSVQKNDAYNSYLKVAHAVASAHIEKCLDKDLDIIGVKRNNA